ADCLYLLAHDIHLDRQSRGRLVSPLYHVDIGDCHRLRHSGAQAVAMTFSLTFVATIGLAYLLLIFGIATITDRGWIPRRITEHPITYVLSLGIFASAWAFYGVIDLAFQFGYGALA